METSQFLGKTKSELLELPAHLPAGSLTPSPRRPQDNLTHVAIETGITKSSIISGWRAEKGSERKRDVASVQKQSVHILLLDFVV